MKHSVLAACAFACAFLLSTFAEAKPLRAIQPACNGPDIMRPCMVLEPQSNFLTGVKEIRVSMKREKVRKGIRRVSSYAVQRVLSDASDISWGGSTLVDRAKSYMGQTARQIGVRSSLWCSAFLRHVTGASGVDDRAISWLAKPRVTAGVGAIAVMRHHVGVVSGFDNRGNPIVVSGNHGRRVGEGVYARSRILAFVSAS